MKIAHLSDVHIRNYQYHDDYQEVFQKLYKKLEDQEPDQIFVTGDIAHTKTNLSPDYFDLASEFFKELADISPLKVFIGNHDCSLRNKSRKDAISPVINAISSDNIEFFKESKKKQLTDNINLYHLSIFDKDWDDLESEEGKINIAVFHGTVAGAETDIGWVMKDGEIEFETLEKFDYALLGDIHKPNQALDEEGRVRYAGSLIQQNYGENDDRGYLLWDIQSKEDFECDHIYLPNPKPFYTTEVEDVEIDDIPDNCRLRLKGGSYSKTQEKLEEIRKGADTYSTSYVLSGSAASSDLKSVSSKEENKNLRDPSVQENLLEEFFEGKLDEDTLDKVKEYNREYEDQINDKKITGKNWSLKELKWNDLFNFGEGNKINFEDKNGIVGIFGENYSGKSSIIDALIYTIFNSNSKSYHKNQYVVNQDHKKGDSKATLTLDGEEYHIERSTKKQKQYDKQTSITKNNFWKYDSDGNKQTLNRDSRRKTDKAIRELFGGYEEFKITSFAAQFGSQTYISKGATKRKSILAKFLDLKRFSKKYDMATDDLSTLRADLRQYEGETFEEDLKSLREESEEIENRIGELSNLEEKYQSELNSLKSDKKEITESIENVPAEPIDIDQIEQDLDVKKRELELKQNHIKSDSKEIDEIGEEINSLKDFIDQTDIEKINDELKEAGDLNKQLVEIESRIASTEAELEEIKEYSEYIGNPPCSADYECCKLVEDAHEKVEDLERVENELESYKETKSELESELEKYDINNLQNIKEEYQNKKDRLSELESKKKTVDLRISSNKNECSEIEKGIESLKEKKQKYYDNQDAIENLEDMLDRKEKLEQEITQKESDLKNVKEEKEDLYKKSGFIEQKIENTKEDKEKLEKLRFKFESLEKFREAMHSDGIPFEIIKSNLEKINNEMEEVISGFFDFNIFFENNNGDLEIFISKPDEDPRPIELGSGAEKTIASIVIRLALLNITAMPKGDIFILDEPATELDEDNMQSFINVLDMIKSNFRVVILITHLEHLKDNVDEVITIGEDEEGYAHVEE